MAGADFGGDVVGPGSQTAVDGPLELSVEDDLEQAGGGSHQNGGSQGEEQGQATPQ